MNTAMSAAGKRPVRTLILRNGAMINGAAPEVIRKQKTLAGYTAHWFVALSSVSSRWYHCHCRGK